MTSILFACLLNGDYSVCPLWLLSDQMSGYTQEICKARGAARALVLPHLGEA